MPRLAKRVAAFEVDNNSFASSFSPPLALDLPFSFSPSLTKRTTFYIKTFHALHKKNSEIKAADDQASALERRARSALEAREGLACDMRVAAKDALRLQASLPALEEEAREAEGQLEAFR